MGELRVAEYFSHDTGFLNLNEFIIKSMYCHGLIILFHSKDFCWKAYFI